MLSSPRLSIIALIALTAAVSGCGSSSSSSALTTATGPTPTLVTEMFSGSIDQNGTAIFNFTVNNAGYNLLAGYSSITPATVSALGLGIGNWDPGSQTCGLNQTQNDISHSGSTAVSVTAGAGTFCVRVYPAGNIAAGVTAAFTVQVEHY